MNEFDLKAKTWDQNPMHRDRSVAIVNALLEQIQLSTEMSAMEFGAGTGITSFLLKDKLKNITMLDNSSEMVRIMNEKIKSENAVNLQALSFDLEHNDWAGRKFDLIMTQMVLHHVNDIKNIFEKFYNILNPGGYLAIADLYSEDGSFHGEGFTGHKGFDVDVLTDNLLKNGFMKITHRKCFTINKTITETESKPFDVFLIVAERPENPL
jgi:tRNA (cmo5U34)-methyltransferase